MELDRKTKPEKSPDKEFNPGQENPSSLLEALRPSKSKTIDNSSNLLHLTHQCVLCSNKFSCAAGTAPRMRDCILLDSLDPNAFNISDRSTTYFEIVERVRKGRDQDKIPIDLNSNLCKDCCSTIGNIHLYSLTLRSLEEQLYNLLKRKSPDPYSEGSSANFDAASGPGLLIGSSRPSHELSAPLDSQSDASHDEDDDDTCAENDDILHSHSLTGLHVPAPSPQSVGIVLNPKNREVGLASDLVEASLGVTRTYHSVLSGHAGQNLTAGHSLTFESEATSLLTCSGVQLVSAAGAEGHGLVGGHQGHDSLAGQNHGPRLVGSTEDGRGLGLDIAHHAGTDNSLMVANTQINLNQDFSSTAKDVEVCQIELRRSDLFNNIHVINFVIDEKIWSDMFRSKSEDGLDDGCSSVFLTLHGVNSLSLLTRELFNNCRLSFPDLDRLSNTGNVNQLCLTDLTELTGRCTSSNCSLTFTLRVVEKPRLELEFSGNTDHLSYGGPFLTRLFLTTDASIMNKSSHNPKITSNVPKLILDGKHLVQNFQPIASDPGPSHTTMPHECSNSGSKMADVCLPELTTLHGDRTTASRPTEDDLANDIRASNDDIHSGPSFEADAESVELVKKEDNDDLTSSGDFGENSSQLVSTARRKPFNDELVITCDVKLESSDCPVLVAREYSCPHCDRKFSKKSNRDSHLLVHSSTKPYQCDQCQRSFKRLATLEEHRRNVHLGVERSLFACQHENCDKTFKTQTGLRMHKSAVHNVGPSKNQISCPECSRMFRCNADLKVHQVVHTKEKSFFCDECGMAFTRKNSLVDHQKIHSRKYECKDCGKCFGRSSRLQGHSRVCQKGKLFLNVASDDDSQLKLEQKEDPADRLPEEQQHDVLQEIEMDKTRTPKNLSIKAIPPSLLHRETSDDLLPGPEALLPSVESAVHVAPVHHPASILLGGQSITQSISRLPIQNHRGGIPIVKVQKSTSLLGEHSDERKPTIRILRYQNGKTFILQNDGELTQVKVMNPPNIPQ